jgi:hypothetical protein
MARFLPIFRSKLDGGSGVVFSPEGHTAFILSGKVIGITQEVGYADLYVR